MADDEEFEFSTPPPDDEFNEFGGGDDEFSQDASNPPEEEFGDGEIDFPEVGRTHASKTIFVTQQFRFFENDYEKIRPIGEPGQFGMALECVRKRDGRTFCVKEINKARFHHISPEQRDDILRTMQNEIGILKRVEHPNIVALYDVYEDRHKLHLVMEMLPGGELFERICEEESFDEMQAARTTKQILEALEYMHEKNIVHLDLKPDNIIFASREPDSPIKLIDFGMARIIPKLSRLKDRVGTINYMAPEVLKGHYSKAADVWSCGVIVFCMLFGFPPFYVDREEIIMDETELLEEQIMGGFDPVVKEGYGPWFPEDIPISEECQHLITHMLESDVKRRWTVTECLSSNWICGKFGNNSIPPVVRQGLLHFRKTNKFKIAVSRIFAEQMDREHLQQIRIFFNALDTNKDGSITLQEFKDGMHRLAPDLPEQAVETMFENIDIDDSRTITIDELITATSHRALVGEDERLYQMFNELDADQDGKITERELKQALKSVLGDLDNIGDERRMFRDRIKSHIRTRSAMAGNQAVDYEEFLRILHPEFNEISDFDKEQDTADRYRGANFNVDYGAMASDAIDDKLMMHTQSGKRKRKSVTLQPVPEKGSTVSTVNPLQETPMGPDVSPLAVQSLENTNAYLREELEAARDDHKEMMQKYSKLQDTIEQPMQEAVHRLKSLEKELTDRWVAMSQQYEERLKAKNQVIQEKDVKIEGLTAEVDATRRSLKEAQDKIALLERQVAEAVEQKMHVLRRAQNEIDNIRFALLGPNAVSRRQ